MVSRHRQHPSSSAPPVCASSSSHAFPAMAPRHDQDQDSSRRLTYEDIVLQYQYQSRHSDPVGAMALPIHSHLNASNNRDALSYEPQRSARHGRYSRLVVEMAEIVSGGRHDLRHATRATAMSGRDARRVAASPYALYASRHAHEHSHHALGPHRLHSRPRPPPFPVVPDQRTGSVHHHHHNDVLFGQDRVSPTEARSQHRHSHTEGHDSRATAARHTCRRPPSAPAASAACESPPSAYTGSKSDDVSSSSVAESKPPLAPELSLVGQLCAKRNCYRQVSPLFGDFCEFHKPSRLCKVPECQKCGKTGGFCISHGGGRRCQTSGCTKSAKEGGRCISHGGGKRCRADGCNRAVCTSGWWCLAHSKDDKATKTACVRSSSLEKEADGV